MPARILALQPRYWYSTLIYAVLFHWTGAVIIDITTSLVVFDNDIHDIIKPNGHYNYSYIDADASKRQLRQ